MLNPLDRYILTNLQRQHITPLVRLLYRVRRRWLCWHIKETGRVVRGDVTLDEGVRRARGRVYGVKGGMR